MAAIANWNIEAMTGYEPKTTFYTDFSIADVFGGEPAIRDTYKRAFKGWKSNTEYVTELVMVLNWKSWEHSSKGNNALAKLYVELYYELDNWCVENLKGDDLQYYYRTID